MLIDTPFMSDMQRLTAYYFTRDEYPNLVNWPAPWPPALMQMWRRRPATPEAEAKQEALNRAEIIFLKALLRQHLTRHEEAAYLTAALLLFPGPGPWRIVHPHRQDYILGNILGDKATMRRRLSKLLADQERSDYYHANPQTTAPSKSPPTRDIAAIKAHSDIVDVVGHYLPLKQRGRLFWGLCPFHAEKTPSFIVYPETQSWYCFGCNRGGDVIEFLMLKEGVDFNEALGRLP